MSTAAMTRSDFDALAVSAEAPFVGAPLPMTPGGVDPLGLRQLNFELMDRSLPGLNNLASRLRIYVLLAWAWWKAGQLATLERTGDVKTDRLRSFVDRMEVIFAVSHLLHDDFYGFLGRDTLQAKVIKKDGYDFGASAWMTFRKDRELISSFMAPVAYGPSAKIGLGLGVIAPVSGGAFAPVEDVMPAVLAFERRITPILSEPCFSQLDGGYVPLSDMKRFYQYWCASDLSPDEMEVGHARLYAKDGALPRRNTIDALVHILNSADKPMTVAELRHALGSSAAPGQAHLLSADMKHTMAIWRALQARQLFRQSLEGLLNWVLSICTVPMSLRSLAESLQNAQGVGRYATVNQWLDASRSSADELQNIADPVLGIEALTEVRQYLRPDLGLEGIRASFLIYQEARPESEAALYIGQRDRLPLALAATRLSAIGDLPFREGLEVILAEWIIGQHVYWAVGRSGDDTQRLRLMLDEGGWLSFYGKPANANATPDRLATALRLMADCGLVTEDRSIDPPNYHSNGASHDKAQ